MSYSPLTTSRSPLAAQDRQYGKKRNYDRQVQNDADAVTSFPGNPRNSGIIVCNRYISHDVFVPVVAVAAGSAPI